MHSLVNLLKPQTFSLFIKEANLLIQ